jgi:hypothetical protein
MYIICIAPEHWKNFGNYVVPCAATVLMVKIYFSVSTRNLQSQSKPATFEEY